MTLSADDVIIRFNLERHPEGGWYRQTWVGDETPRAAGTCILFLLKAGEKSHWHRVDAAEIWHFYTGAPIVLSLSPSDAGPRHEATLGPDLLEGQSPQVIIPKGHWQSARATSGWALVGCTVSPGFLFEGFELAPPGFDIPR